MKKTIYVIAALFCPLVVLAAEPETCADKKNQIEEALVHARQHKQSDRIHGLETALSNLNRNCRDDQLKEEHQEDIQKKQDKLTKAQSELQDAITDKKSPAKIQEKKDKVTKAQGELDKLK